MLGGFSGFGLLGMAASYGPHQAGLVFGFYGPAWSVYTNVIARGNDVTFRKNTSIGHPFRNSSEIALESGSIFPDILETARFSGDRMQEHQICV